MEQKLAEERSAKLRLENMILELEKHSSMMDCDYKQALQKLDELRRHKDRLTEEVSVYTLCFRPVKCTNLTPYVTACQFWGGEAWLSFISRFKSIFSILNKIIPSGKEFDPEDRAGDPEENPDSERLEVSEPAAQRSEDLRETTQTGNQPPPGH